LGASGLFRQAVRKAGELNRTIRDHLGDIEERWPNSLARKPRLSRCSRLHVTLRTQTLTYGKSTWIGCSPRSMRAEPARAPGSTFMVGSGTVTARYDRHYAHRGSAERGR
jgi:hypothetical protein